MISRFAETVGGLVRRSAGAVIAIVVVVALVVVGAVVLTGGNSKTYHLTAYFDKTVGLYVGNDVEILGVKVGKIQSITPVGPQVKVVMSYDGNDKVPATADAVIIEPSIVSDRYIQLTPGYAGGNEPVLANNAVLGMSRTREPLELDDVFGNINTLDTALGPKGANKNGALSRLLKVGAANLAGNGGHLNAALKEFASAVSTLAGSRGDLFGTVDHLEQFTSTLAANDTGVRKLNANLALVGGQLASERKDLGAALANLSTALSSVNNFVANNRNDLTSDIHSLSKVTNVLTQEKAAITQFTDTAPLALSDLGLSYDPESMTLDTKADTTEPLTAHGSSSTTCQLLTTLGLSNLLGGVEGCSTTLGKSVTIQPSSERPHTLAGLLGVGQ